MSKEKYWHEFFELGVIIKALDGTWETITGVLFLFLSKATFAHWFFVVSHNELLEDPNDIVMNFLSHALQNFSGDAKTFAAVYLLSRGILNIFLAIQLYQEKHWAHLLAIGTLLVFMAYQAYRISLYHSALLTVVTVFDAIFILLIWHEYMDITKA